MGFWIIAKILYEKMGIKDGFFEGHAREGMKRYEPQDWSRADD
jgi:hypothetical protein